MFHETLRFDCVSLNTFPFFPLFVRVFRFLSFFCFIMIFLLFLVKIKEGVKGNVRVMSVSYGAEFSNASTTTYLLLALIISIRLNYKSKTILPTANISAVRCSLSCSLSPLLLSHTHSTVQALARMYSKAWVPTNFTVYLHILMTPKCQKYQSLFTDTF